MNDTHHSPLTTGSGSSRGPPYRFAADARTIVELPDCVDPPGQGNRRGSSPQLTGTLHRQSQVACAPVKRQASWLGGSGHPGSWRTSSTLEAVTLAIGTH